MLGLFNSGNMTVEYAGPAASLGKGNAPVACTTTNRSGPGGWAVLGTNDHTDLFQVLGG